MKKLYKKSTVHPSPPPPIADHLSLLPAAIFTLTIALSPQDKEVLAYLLSSSTTKKTTKSSSSAAADHPPLFNCSCFRCYMSYWVRWDSSPNRQLIHEIIDALEDGLVRNKKEKSKKDRKKKVISSSSNEETRSTESDELTQSPEVSPANMESVVEYRSGGGGDDEEEGPVRKLVSFLGERIWSVWT
ncbi:uncharacterized protein LOC112502473 [Cynara cardunculus var. scolymus]|uniref:Uncharacterized protein n=1 Tax=Cynara cardunculus var. scolymus TaxID=59895 RepID=A0A103XCG7_CYNCS|nr:uncharacterized protein LOC112502473 [Cynara cardunculus var. scolymus]KVH88176.1 hypothetical protein Ccrd_024435 [Cynara cardunculus var. scolymus]